MRLIPYRRLANLGLSGDFLWSPYMLQTTHYNPLLKPGEYRPQ
jgi:hypothetical protein